ncbi:O6-methylguanine-DNA methyltransferase [Lactococcus lactis subsp. lactis IO-1]|nr:O6-methylguanine-DNA methyltransferase [Lactococcus lactis subsp. lactis IO-1]
MMIEIRLFNPYIDITYRTDDFPIERWYQFLDNFRKGNEEIISFRPTYEEIRGSDANSKIPDIVTICPRNWGKVSVVELEGSGDEQSN